MRAAEIVIAVEGGLCNRLRVLCSALALRPALQRPVRIAWADNAECAAPFERLFEPLDLPDFRITPRAWHEAPAARRNLHLPRLWRAAFYDWQTANYQAEVHGPLPAIAARHRRIYLSTCYAFADYAPSVVRSLRPLPHLQRRIDALAAGFDERTVGVHIRRTDNVAAIRHSSVEAFRRAMAGDESNFFLATDDEDLKAELRAAYGHRLTTQSTHGRRDTLAGMEEAVVDLYALARTRRLLGSFWSSFTDTAAEIGGIPLTIIHH